MAPIRVPTMLPIPPFVRLAPPNDGSSDCVHLIGLPAMGWPEFRRPIYTMPLSAAQKPDSTKAASVTLFTLMPGKSCRLRIITHRADLAPCRGLLQSHMPYNIDNGNEPDDICM